MMLLMLMPVCRAVREVNKSEREARRGRRGKQTKGDGLFVVSKLDARSHLDVEGVISSVRHVGGLVDVCVWMCVCC